MCIKSTLYRVTYKGRDSRDDCTDFFVSVFLYLRFRAIASFFLWIQSFYSPLPHTYVCIQITRVLSYSSPSGEVYIIEPAVAKICGGGLQCSTGCPTNHDSGKTTCRSSLMYFAACLCQPNFKLKLKLYNWLSHNTPRPGISKMLSVCLCFQYYPW